MRDEKEKANTPAPRKSRFGDSYLEMKRWVENLNISVSTNSRNHDHDLVARQLMRSPFDLKELYTIWIPCHNADQ